MALSRLDTQTLTEIRDAIQGKLDALALRRTRLVDSRGEHAQAITLLTDQIARIDDEMARWNKGKAGADDTLAAIAAEG